MINEKNILNILRDLPYNNQINSSNFLDDVGSFSSLTEKFIITTDSLVEGWHCLNNSDPFDMGWKLMARNLSDIASKGGCPVYFLLNLFLPNKTTPNFCQNFTDGITQLLKVCKLTNFNLVGGDTTYSKADHFIATITIIAKTSQQYPQRQNMDKGDSLYLSGRVGGAFIGYSIDSKCPKFASFFAKNLPSHEQDKYVEKYRRPVPLIKEGRKIRQFASATMDTSDGIVIEIPKILHKTLNVKNYIKNIPIEEVLQLNMEAKTDALNFGDDYQILFSAKETSIHKSIFLEENTFLG